MTGPVPLWETLGMRAAAGNTLRPGGFALTDRAAERIGVLPGWRVLDVGSGLGATVGRLRSRYGAEAWGVEPSAVQIDRSDCGCHLIPAKGDALPFDLNIFQAVFCECVLSLFDDPKCGLDEFYRVIAPGGFLVLADLYSLGNELPGGGASCADRAVPLAQTQALAKEAGFTLRLVEDHSNHLKELAARLLMTGEECCCSNSRGLGYYMMILQKEGDCRV